MLFSTTQLVSSIFSATQLSSDLFYWNCLETFGLIMLLFAKAILSRYWITCVRILFNKLCGITYSKLWILWLCQYHVVWQSIAQIDCQSLWSLLLHKFLVMLHTGQSFSIRLKNFSMYVLLIKFIHTCLTISQSLRAWRIYSSRSRQSRQWGSSSLR